MPGIMGRYEPGMVGSPPPRSANVMDVYSKATQANLSDYDRMMAGFKSVGDNASQTPIQPINYQPSADVTNALAAAKNFSDTGGYSDQDISSIRARGISPIQSVYANANRSLDRSRVLSGGYNPGFAANKVKLARQQSQELSRGTNDINANIAQLVASGKQYGTSQYGSMANAESNRSLDAQRFNTGIPGMNDERQLAALRGASSLYGTSPALASTFGQHALESARMGQQDNQFRATMDNQNRRDIMSKGYFT